MIVCVFLCVPVFVVSLSLSLHMAISVSEQDNDGFVPDIIMLTLCY